MLFTFIKTIIMVVCNVTNFLVTSPFRAGVLRFFDMHRWSYQDGFIIGNNVSDAQENSLASPKSSGVACSHKGRLTQLRASISFSCNSAFIMYFWTKYNCFLPFPC